VGYAVQWFGLAAAVLVTALLLTWRSRRSAGKGR
jgi:cytochrome oxidase assembly protein ShyY1